MLASCSADRASVEVQTEAQKNDFSVTPKYCHANDCFSVTKATMIQLYNDRLPNGSDAFKVTTTTIFDGEQEVARSIVNRHVEGDIVTLDMEYFVAQFNQRTKEMLEIISKTRELSEKEAKILKDMIRQMSGLVYTKYASSGDVIIYDMEINIQSTTALIRIITYVHGLTEYEGKNYCLLESRGGGTAIFKGQKLLISISGYTLGDGTVDMAAKSVTDMTLRYGNNLQRLQISRVVKKMDKSATNKADKSTITEEDLPPE
jgi:hypothetical protein